jgi:hypothetical protein
MSRVHICNTFFEKELEKPMKRTLMEWMRSHHIVMQLQFLPLIYAGSNDRILVSDLPPNPDPRLCLLDDPPKDLPIEDWGPSLAIATWAKKHGLFYPDFNWECIREINSKNFSFTHSPKLPGAALLQNQQELEEWILKTPGPKVLKTPFGTAGNGHIHINKTFLGAPFTNVKLVWPVIAEPWVERVLDFSTQWKEGKLVGVTVFENEYNGTYKGTTAAQVEAWALGEHLKIAEPLVEKIKTLGFSGHIGIDAFIYLWQGVKKVHPIVEINARKTMSWVALQTKEKCLYYTHAQTGLLPNRLRNVEFTRNLSQK